MRRIEDTRIVSRESDSSSPTASIVDLWGNEQTPFSTAKERYGIWPTTVWPCDLSDPATRRLKAAIGDDGAARRAPRVDGNFSGYQISASVFNPAVAVWALNCWAAEGSTVFDPFAGGGTRALVAAALGYQYLGVELRKVEVAEVAARVERSGFASSVTLWRGDARRADALIGSRRADFLLTCPPYWNLERYDGGPADLSQAPTIEAFEEGITEVARAAARVVRPGGLAFWVVGLMRDRHGTLLPLHHVVVRAHEDAGWSLAEEVVLHQQNNGAIQRVGSFEKGRKHLIRLHEYGLLMRNDSLGG